MKLWSLGITKAGREGLTVEYDIVLGFVIWAKSPKAARKLAASRCGDEGPTFWLTIKSTWCEVAYAPQEERILLRSFNAS